MPFFRSFSYYWLPVLVYCGLIFFQSSFPSPVHGPRFSHSDKILHFTGYGLLGALFFRAFTGGRPEWSFRKRLFLSLLSAGGYGVTDEMHQLFVHGRTGDILDVAADFLGAMTGAGIYGCSRRRKETRVMNPISGIDRRFPKGKN